MRVREAVSEDIPDLMRLNAEVQALHIELFPERFKETDRTALREWFSALLAEEDTRCLVATSDSDVIGYVTARFVTRPGHVFRNPERYVYVDQICVAKTTRRKGVAKGLFAAVRDLARKAGLTRIALDVWSANTNAKKAFAALGFETYNEKMELTLD
ncbi:MAG: GNAT family N-acetyltransferase [Candidatus Hydrogenedentes bacterium]|nr:GNAT family N-acetyltransferase [Candidatus Hydrogenedentota bacterium]